MAERADADGWPLGPEAVVGTRGGALAWVEALLVQATIGLVARLPRGPRGVVVSGLARLAMRFDRAHVAAARGFLEQAFGPELDDARRDELVLGSYRHLFDVTLDFARFRREYDPAHPERWFTFEVTDEVREALLGGAIAFSGHLGNWEVGPSAFRALGVRHLYAVSRPPKNKYLSISAQREREALGYRLIHRHGAIAGTTKVLAGGGVVMMLLDQRAHGKTVLAPFFGRPAHCERGVAVLVRRLGRPVCPLACYVDGPGRFRFVGSRVITPEEVRRASPEAVATTINAEIERMIRVAPDQYFWLHDRYRKAPPAPAPGSPEGAAPGEAPAEGGIRPNP